MEYDGGVTPPSRLRIIEVGRGLSWSEDECLIAGLLGVEGSCRSVGV